MFTVLNFYRHWIIVVLLAIGLGGGTVGGYYYLRYQSRESHLCEASYHYLQLINTIETEDKAVILTEKANDFIKKYSDTPYAASLQLYLAKKAIDNNQLSEGVKWLSLVAQDAQDSDTRSIARQRAARVLISMQKFKEALALLNEATWDPAYIAATEELKGDILCALNEKEKGLEAYHKAYSTDPQLAKHNNPLLAMKIAHLAS